MVIHMTWKEMQRQVWKKADRCKKIGKPVCFNGAAIDLTGKRFGRLTVIQVTSVKAGEMP